MNKLLIVDDEANIRTLIKKYALKEGYLVDEADDGEKAISLCEENDYDLIIMDIMMKNIDGFQAVNTILKEKDVAIIMLSALGDEFSKIHGFDLGIDDYVVKPFSPKVLMKRVKAILKRNGKIHDNDLLTFKGLSVNLRGHAVLIDEHEIKLSPKEYDLLLYLLENKGIALTREQLLRKIWGYDYYGDDRTLDTHIKLLRKNIGEYAKYITTLRGVGYRFEKE